MNDSPRLFFIATISSRRQVVLYFAVLATLGAVFWPVLKGLIFDASLFQTVFKSLG